MKLRLTHKLLNNSIILYDADGRCNVTHPLRYVRNTKAFRYLRTHRDQVEQWLIQKGFEI